MAALMDTYARLPVAFSHGTGAYLYDEQGNKYLDALAGLAVTGLGHAHPGVAAAITRQANTLMHTSNLYRISLQESLADRITALAGMDRVFFCNSGAEANEAAIKIARLYGHGRDINKPHIIAMEGSFHGRTMATLTATGNRKVQAGFEPLLSGFVRAPYNDVKAIETIAENNNEVVAILVEPVLGEGGIVVPDDGYLPALRRICDAKGWLLMLDEVQTGNGRTGRYFAYQHTRDPARRRYAGERSRKWTAHRRVSGARHRGRNAETRQPRVDVRRQSARVRRRACGDRRIRERRTDGTRRACSATGC